MAEALSGWEVYSLPQLWRVEPLLSLSVPLGVWMEGGGGVDRPSNSPSPLYQSSDLSFPVLKRDRKPVESPYVVFKARRQYWCQWQPEARVTGPTNGRLNIVACSPYTI